MPNANSLKKFIKNARKSYKQTNLTKLSKSWKSAYFRQIFSNNFFVGIFYHFLKWFWNQHKLLCNK